MNDLAEFMHSAAGGGKLPLYQQLQQALRRRAEAKLVKRPILTKKPKNEKARNDE